MSKRRLIYGSVRRFEAGPVISQKPRICGLGLDFCFYPQTNQRGRSTARVYARRWDFFSLHYSSLSQTGLTGRSMIFHGLPRILRIIKQWIFAFNRVHKSNALADAMRCFSPNNHSAVVERLLLRTRREPDGKGGGWSSFWSWRWFSSRDARLIRDRRDFVRLGWSARSGGRDRNCDD